ncbi:MAG TPA: hypothetical protein VF070_18365 [Streptosporangiaceae bacterium]
MSRLVGMFRLVAILSIAAVALGLTVPAATAAPAPTKIDADLTALWTKVLETPSAQNSFGSGGVAFACWNIGGGTVAPFGPSGVPSCTVKPGTKILVVASSFECSTFPGDTNPSSPTEAALRTCAEQNDVHTAPSVTVDGQSVPVREVETRLMNIVLPADNLFGLPAGATGLSVGHGWVVHLDPLTPGTHTIVGSGSATFTTAIIVKPGQ